MAIIQSILVGKGKGKIGNVVLSNLKGQTVAKQLNSSPSNPRTVAQTDNRVKMANAVLAWQFLALFFIAAKGLRKPLESNYNAFVRTVVSDMPAVLVSSRSVAALAALNLNNFAGNWFIIDSLVPSSGSAMLKFSASGIPWADTYRVRVIEVITATGEQRVHDEPILENHFIAGEIDASIQAFAGVDFGAAYIYDSASSKITNVIAKAM